MAIAEDLPMLEQSLNELIKKYELYFIGLEKRAPEQLFNEISRLIRTYAGVPINNTMYKHRYTTLVARFNTYQQHWNRTLRQIEDGKFSRDRFISDLRQRSRGAAPVRESRPERSLQESEVDRIFEEFREARRMCNLPVDNLTRDMIAATIDKQKPVIAARLGTEELAFRVVVEGGKPKIKAGLRK